ncbi:MAG: hypothetical protein FWD14_04550 [Treponema sp.]|nr:hypothetical protein [Treponema sp.]
MAKFKYLICILISFIIFIGCTRTNVLKQNQDNDTHLRHEIVQEKNIAKNDQYQYINENYFTLMEIKEYIHNDLNIKYSFDTIEELLATLKITGDYNINSFIEEILPHDAIYNVYKIEWNSHSIRYHKYSYSNDFSYYGITIILNEDNYLHIFPYRNIDKYLLDNNFGKIYEENILNGSIEYGIGWIENDPFAAEYCILKFNDGVLYSISFGRNYS